MKRLALLGLSAMLFAACTGKSGSTTTSPSSDASSAAPVGVMATKKTTVTLSEQNKSGQTGTMTMEELADGKTKVTLTMTGGSFTDQPAHIHEGSCPSPGLVKYPLKNVMNGKSETVLSTKYADVLASATKLAVNVHKSPMDLKTYTACGDVK